jgi:quinol monooxygenase YgiN
MIIVLGSVTVRADGLEQALALSREHVARSRTEPGCVAHAVHQDVDAPLRLVFVEQWTDRAALQQHFLVPASRAFVKALGALAIGAPAMAIYDATAVSSQP